MAELLTSLLDEWGLKRSREWPCYITTDKGSNIKKATGIDMVDVTGVHCFSHLLHCALLEAFTEPGYKEPVNKIARFGEGVHRSIPRTCSLRAIQ